MQNDSYKLYDTNKNATTFTFVKISKDQPNSPPLKNPQLTAEERSIKESFKVVFASYHK